MTRLASSARDYAIALIARREGELFDALASLRLAGIYEDAKVETWHANSEWRASHVTRLVRARLALYLRLLRRVEAWEVEGCLWSGWAAPGWRFTRKGVPRSEPARMQWTPWRPLWTSAPHFDPQITARMRREAR